MKTLKPLRLLAIASAFDLAARSLRLSVEAIGSLNEFAIHNDEPDLVPSTAYRVVKPLPACLQPTRRASVAAFAHDTKVVPYRKKAKKVNLYGKTEKGSATYAAHLVKVQHVTGTKLMSIRTLARKVRQGGWPVRSTYSLAQMLAHNPKVVCLRRKWMVA